MTDSLNAQRALAAGAIGYVTRDEPGDAMADAVGRALDGRVGVSGPVKRPFVREIASVWDSTSRSIC